MTVRCYWCGSSDTHFDHFACWQEDQVGNPIEVQSLEEAAARGLSVKDENWWCNTCDGGFGGPVESAEK